ncbi:MAG: UDP-N-acetylglucosamine diphosphorylase/glucosamine-1-phosphate N-acetyltransferase [Limnohabitans sp.]|nr:UDP-N-acetylglucosamine diphosphorylase/glucosamine-1-phosphate N-acetyltransferase [Limnohabitans sp.]
MAIDVVIMAAGKGTRMKSSMPKVLHRVGGKALIEHVMDAQATLKPRKTVVITGHGAESVEAALQVHKNLQFARQMPQLGTGHAAQQATPLLDDDGCTLILSGDVPLIRSATLQKLIEVCAGKHLALLSLNLQQPTGYGRIIRDAKGVVKAIIEEKDATTEKRAIEEIYTGIMVAPTHLLRQWLSQLDNNNAQKEYYLTDVVKFAVAQNCAVVTHTIDDEVQVAGVNSPAQLAQLERAYQWRQAQSLMEQGVRLTDPARLDIRGQLHCESDVEIDANCIFEGQVKLGQDVRIGANCCIANAVIGAGTVIQAFTHIDGESKGVQIGSHVSIGPFARLRSGAQLADDVHIGNFVEIKNASLAKGAKANHLAYLGDSIVGQRVNFGAGSITANYDGANKHTTHIEDDVHIGSNCVLVAPVTIGKGGTVGGGSTITKDTPPDQLTVARGKQVSIQNWQRPKKN